MRPLAACLAAMSMLLLRTAASADVTAIAGGSPDHIDLAMPVTASVAAACNFAAGAAPGGTYNADILAGFTHDFSYAVQCNGPFRIAVQSANGGLFASGSGTSGGYSDFAAYTVTLAIVGDAGVPSVNAQCDAATLTSTAQTPCSFRGPATSTQGLKLNGTSSGASGSYVRISAPAYDGSILVASSSYADTLTVTLSASL